MLELVVHIFELVLSIISRLVHILHLAHKLINVHIFEVDLAAELLDGFLFLNLFELDLAF